ncbi:MAG: hypothetical protein CUN55_12320 [Phototrophicales bacterium]|nr:MAG: hypothetical protein CUN55_12320 [Phototrophicales bacterium]
MDKIIFNESPFLHIIEREGYFFLHMARTAGRLVAIVPYRQNAGKYEYLARVEICPAHFPANTTKSEMQPRLYSITGGVKPDEDFRSTAARELKEESGYEVNAAALIDLGQVYPSKQEDTIAQLYSVDLSSVQQQTIEGDGSVWEQGAGVQWVSFAEGLKICDPLFVTAMVRVREQLGV